jgi:hypothetical protein
VRWGGAEPEKAPGRTGLLGQLLAGHLPGEDLCARYSESYHALCPANTVPAQHARIARARVLCDEGSYPAAARLAEMKQIKGHQLQGPQRDVGMARTYD